MVSFRIKKGLNLNPAGRPAGEAQSLSQPLERIGVSPARIDYIKPRLHIKTGDRVRRGSLLFVDKRRPEVHFLSPGGGEVESIIYGPRRVIEAIVIRLDADEDQEQFDSVTAEELAEMDRGKLVQHLLTGGLWPLLRSLPFRDIADPAVEPPALLVSLDNLDPFHPGPEIYLNGDSDRFRLGLLALQQLSPQVYVITSYCDGRLPAEVRSLVSHTIRGCYPADDPGVFVYHTRTSSEDNQSWFVSGADVLLLGTFLQSGRYPTERFLSVVSPQRSGYIRTRLGAPVSQLLPEIAGDDGWKVLSGGLWRGRVIGPEAYLGLYETSLVVLADGGQAEFLGFARPGWKKPTQSRTFLSRIRRQPLPMDTGQHGEERACINCGSCARVCPVDILPQFTVKSILAGEVEEALAHGLLDCVECGLCSYVCPSKIELAQQLRQARHDYYREKGK